MYLICIWLSQFGTNIRRCWVLFNYYIIMFSKIRDPPPLCEHSHHRHRLPTQRICSCSSWTKLVSHRYQISIRIPGENICIWYQYMYDIGIGMTWNPDIGVSVWERILISVWLTGWHRSVWLENCWYHYWYESQDRYLVFISV